MKRRILAIFLAIAMTLGLFFTPPSLAVGNQESDRGAVLTASSPNFEINLYPKPDSKSERLGYGLSADKVIILQQMSTNGGYSWYRVRFDNPPYAEGWIRGDYLKFINQDNAASFGKDTYLGNRSSR